ncbi:helix-turn-helix transcriptional regulator [Erwinia pyrifoliae]|uniref:LuxR C-terminal-related transcriptional regulator n=1 Tax=Erwinia pyrifoliae TaxID=79967 RepID=A0ABY5X8Q1_ERWPY|nr:LuxR C-terminal-related transcriptional regulator [Erwinia pyrifoliae]UWS33497.1 LuxR C-terminal-related transcriptional regulator [Erwinia pyrifoliae]
MHVISDCVYFELAVKKTILNESKMKEWCEKLVVIDMRYLSSPEDALKRVMTFSDLFGGHYFVLIGDLSNVSSGSYENNFLIDARLGMADFVHQLRTLTLRKITLGQCTTWLTGLIHHKDKSQGISLTNMEKKIRALVFKNLSVANMASRLMLSNKTIYSHLNNMKNKYKAHSLNFLYLKIQNGESPQCSREQHELNHAG